MQMLTRFIRSESFGGILLMLMSVIALILANTSLKVWYADFIQTPLYIGTDAWRLSKPLLLWINDGLMAIFFLYIGLEVKREIRVGQLSKIHQVVLPLVAALGGIIIPAVIYTFFNHQNASIMQGWAIPTATDIAFALGILALLGDRVPLSLKIFLMAVAIFDDLAAIVIIAVFYTSDLSMLSLGLASIAIAALVFCNVINVKNLSIYGFIGLLLWVCVLKSGVHATLAGVVLALAIPLTMARKLENALHGWVTYFILPVFAFANAGIYFGDMRVNDFLSPLTLGIALGLFLGKQVGIFGFAFLLIKTKFAQLPENTDWLQLYGVAILCGIGFTMSLFISTLAFNDESMHIIHSRLGIFIGTLFSAVLGYIILRFARR